MPLSKHKRASNRKRLALKAKVDEQKHEEAWQKRKELEEQHRFDNMKARFGIK